MPPHLLDHPFSELELLFKKFTGQSYRARQVCKWVFARHASSFNDMTDLPADLRKELAARFQVCSTELFAREGSHTDSTEKWTLATQDKRHFSAVLLPRKGYDSICISTQVGCAWKCGFCASGLVKFERNLTPGEILDQVLSVERIGKRKIHNVLFMGMGEPLANYPGTLGAIHWLTSPHGFGLSPARVTVSTTGLAPQILKLAGENLKVNLALSLHAPSDDLRAKIMPVSSKFEIREILEACKIYWTKNDADLTMEYILLNDVNDREAHARQLAKLLKSVFGNHLPKINLIPFNPVPALSYKTTDPAQSQFFFDLLKREKFVVHTRKPQGQDIEAACGQLL